MALVGATRGVELFFDMAWLLIPYCIISVGLAHVYIEPHPHFFDLSASLYSYLQPTLSIPETNRILVDI